MSDKIGKLEDLKTSLGNQSYPEAVEQLLKENQSLRETQQKLIELLQKADEYCDKLEWKLFWETKDKVIDEIIKKHSNK